MNIFVSDFELDGIKVKGYVDRSCSHSCVSERMVDSYLHVLHDCNVLDGVKHFVLDIYQTPWHSSMHLPVDFDEESRNSIIKLAFQLRMEKGSRPKVYYCQNEENTVFGRITKKRCFGLINGRISYKNRHANFDLFRVGNTDGPNLGKVNTKPENLKVIDRDQAYDLIVGLDVIDYFCIRDEI